MRIEFTIPGEPSTFTSQRKGVTRRGIFYTKAEAKAEERRIRRLVRPHRPPQPLDALLEVEVTFVAPLTYAQAKRHIDQLSNLDFMLRKGTAPDWDNWPKLLCDCLTKEGFWTDDSRISDGICRKRYGTYPRIIVSIREVPEELS
ncbi:MAG: RusA family crossover junction endodeoxyribonuclease [Opitutaceae bacterium]|nr:RusA family crossover junction endodeoxyribonuclease [Opitutaceae bacterium]